MKKTITRTLAVLLALATLFALTGCHLNINIGKKTFSRGTVTGNVYHSDFADLTFTAPEDWYFYTDDEISSLLGTTADLLKDPESFEKMSKGELIDFFALAPDQSTNVTMSVSKGTLLAELDASLKASTDYLKQQYEQLGFTCTVKDGVERKLGNQSFNMAELDIDLGYGTMTQYFYMRQEGIYFITVTATESDGLGADHFEAMFS